MDDLSILRWFTNLVNLTKCSSNSLLDLLDQITLLTFYYKYTPPALRLTGWFALNRLQPLMSQH